MKNIVQSPFFAFTVWLCFIIFSCNSGGVSGKEGIGATKVTPRVKFLKKPPVASQDTLHINLPAAVFYYPDTLQLETMEALMDTAVYKGIMHDYFFQMRYAHIAMKKNWPELGIVESKSYRYLYFNKKDGSRECIDLDKKDDAYGLFVFDGKKSPLLVDLTNTETQVSDYLK